MLPWKHWPEKKQAGTRERGRIQLYLVQALTKARNLKRNLASNNSLLQFWQITVFESVITKEKSQLDTFTETNMTGTGTQPILSQQDNGVARELFFFLSFLFYCSVGRPSWVFPMKSWLTHLLLLSEMHFKKKSPFYFFLMYPLSYFIIPVLVLSWPHVVKAESPCSSIF